MVAKEETVAKEVAMEAVVLVSEKDACACAWRRMIVPHQ